jgi:endonuclease/exonuclease/phosphatase (EEP) superfamily protein YafD
MSTTSIYIHCANCRQKLRVPPDKLHVAGRCPRCKTSFAAVDPDNSTDQSAMTRGLSRRLVRWLAACCWLWLALVLLLAAVMHLGNESWWLGTLLLYSPRWLALVPAAVLIPFAACWSGRCLAILLSGGVAWLFLVGGYSLHWPGAADSAEPDVLRVLTCNMQGGLADRGSFLTLVARLQPDVVLLQEWNGELNDEAFPDSSWNFGQSGHLWVASRLPIQAAAGLPAVTLHLSGNAGSFEVATESGPIRLINVHLPTPREGISAAIDSRFLNVAELQANTLARFQASSAVRQYCGADDSALVVAGDFNLPIESNIYHKYWSDLNNSFSRRGCGFGWTKYTHWHGVRIDHILYGGQWTCLYCEVCPDIGSDHRPLFAVLQRKK